jgi:hypothetical protein
MYKLKTYTGKYFKSIIKRIIFMAITRLIYRYIFIVVEKDYLDRMIDALKKIISQFNINTPPNYQIYNFNLFAYLALNILELIN